MIWLCTIHKTCWISTNFLTTCHYMGISGAYKNPVRITKKILPPKWAGSFFIAYQGSQHLRHFNSESIKNAGCYCLFSILRIDNKQYFLIVLSLDAQRKNQITEAGIKFSRDQLPSAELTSKASKVHHGA